MLLLCLQSVESKVSVICFSSTKKINNVREADWIGPLTNPSKPPAI